ncbi:CaiB/BaiF CoA-transferase family protein [Reyranella sp.]|uniref:CaiB/BaiF CoA transferase family protein n=1 Tax=Reyranella sp. TaxID=1929291 RepID=UPI00121CB22E|nr:CoA transferase [Reyranella sp.]TAJ81969.1 MAG: CoA transferase [Reyranella sp.]
MTAFSGIRVLDLSRVLAGPFCGQMLADFGADVIKVEDVGGDENRKWAPVIDGQSANFLSVNRGKRGMTLNLKSGAGQEILAGLVRKADVVIDSFLPAVAERLGVDDARLRALRPDLVHATISGYGHEGPLAGKPGYDLMLQAFSGMMAMTGERDGGPVRAGASFIDMATGLLAFSGIASALYARQAGKAGGQHIRVSLMETAIALLGYHVPAYTLGGKVPPRDGSGVWHIVPYQAFGTENGHVLAGATNDAAWQRLCAAIGATELAADPALATTTLRIENRDKVISALSAIFATRSTAAWVDALETANVPCAPVNDLAQTLAHPQVAAMKMVLEVATRGGDSLSLVGVPLNLSTTPAVPGGAPPLLGEHTDAILKDDLDLDASRIAALRKEGVI